MRHWLWVSLLVRGVMSVHVELAFLTPYKSDCASCGAAFISAMQWINATEAAGSGVTVSGTMRDSTTQTDALRGADELLRNKTSHALISDLYSSRVIFTARMGEIHSTPVVGYGSTSDEFTNKLVYPFFSRVVSPDRYQTVALVAAIQSFGWQRIGVLFADEAYGTNFAQELTRAADAAGLIIHSRNSIKYGSSFVDMQLPIRQLVGTGVRVIVLAAISSDVSNAMRAAGAVGATGAGYTWIGTDGVMTDTLFTGANANAGQYVTGLLGMFPRYDPLAVMSTEAYESILTLRSWESHPMVTGDVATALANTTTPLNPWVYYVWDAVLHTTRAVALGFLCANSEYVQDYIRNTTTDNATTGTVRLDAAGDRAGSYSLLNWHVDGFVPVGNVEINTDNTTTVNIRRAEIVWADGSTGTDAVPDDGDFLTPSSSVDVAPIVAPIVVVFVLLIVVMTVVSERNRRKLKCKLCAVREEVKKLGGFLCATEDWGPETTLEDIVGDRAEWYWSEPSPELRARHPGIKDGCEWVPYSEDVTIKLEDAYNRGQLLGIKINDKTYLMDTRSMLQTNTATHYSRKMRRVAPRDVASGQVRTASSLGELQSLLVPRWIIDSGDPILQMTKGDLIDVTRTEMDRDTETEWAYGQAYSVDEIGSSACRTGWFPKNKTEKATIEQTLVLRESLGIHNESDLDPPSTWENMGDTVYAEIEVDLNSLEARCVLDRFHGSLGDLSNRITVKQIIRIQNLQLWQSYIVKLLQIVNLNKADMNKAQLVNECAYHGTTEDIVQRITHQGFNRSFCGRNMCAYGKGVYFARNARYSADPTYASQGNDGLYRMLQCRVAHGRYCQGKSNQLVPDELDPTTHRLYDSTVDSLNNNSMWVVYHDAQAYPEYKIIYARR